MRCALLCMLETVDVELCSLEGPEVLEMLEVLQVMHRVLLCMLEAVEGELCLLEITEVMRCVLLYILEVVEGRLCLLFVSEVLQVSEALEVLRVPEVMRCVLLCILEAVEGRLYLLQAPEVMRCVQVLCRYALRVGSVALFRHFHFSLWSPAERANRGNICPGPVATLKKFHSKPR